VSISICRNNLAFVGLFGHEGHLKILVGKGPGQILLPGGVDTFPDMHGGSARADYNFPDAAGDYSVHVVFFNNLMM
jgi:hypothetical protein